MNEHTSDCCYAGDEPSRGKKRRWRIVVALVVAVLAAFVAWKWWTFVPTPAYLPVSDAWKLTAKHTTSSWGLPCVYVRYDVADSTSAAMAELKPAVLALREWERFRERDSEEILGDIRQHWSGDMEIPESMVTQEIAPILGRKFALSTQAPYVVLQWFGHEESATHHYITARFINVGGERCIVELWDFRIFDH